MAHVKRAGSRLNHPFSIAALTVLTGVVFGLNEMRRARRDREERAAFSAVQALMTPEWMSSSMIVASIPEGSPTARIEADPRVLEAALKIATIMEGIGYSVFARIVPLTVADDLVGGMARVGWRRFQPFVEGSASAPARKRAGNGFQWLAEQLDRHAPSKTTLQIGAPVAHRNWKPEAA
ncbi:MAG: hypothetical protein ACR2MW_08505 [Chthoniobacterales bacterium]